MSADADRIAADFSTIPFENHEARILALAYLDLKRQLAVAEKTKDEAVAVARELQRRYVRTGSA